MIENIIEQIKISENKSKEIIQNARKQHSEIIEKAYAESAGIEDRAKTDISKMYKDSETQAVSDSKIEIGKLEKHYKQKHEEVLSAASLKENEAVDLIIGKVLE